MSRALKNLRSNLESQAKEGNVAKRRSSSLFAKSLASALWLESLKVCKRVPASMTCLFPDTSALISCTFKNLLVSLIANCHDLSLPTVCFNFLPPLFDWHNWKGSIEWHGLTYLIIQDWRFYHEIWSGSTWPDVCGLLVTHKSWQTYDRSISQLADPGEDS